MIEVLGEVLHVVHFTRFLTKALSDCMKSIRMMIMIIRLLTSLLAINNDFH